MEFLSSFIVNETARIKNKILTSNSGGLGKVGPNGGTVSSQYTDNLYVLPHFVTTANISEDIRLMLCFFF